MAKNKNKSKKKVVVPSMPKRKRGESDVDYFKRAVKTANNRMRALEKLSEKDYYKSATKWAYSKARYDIKRLYGKEDGPWRFGTRLKRNQDGSINQQDLQAKMNALQRFLNAPSSTKTGIMEIYQKRADKINKEYKTDLTWEEIGDFWESELARKMLEEYDSDTIMKGFRVWGDLTQDDFMRIKESKKKHKYVRDAVLNDTISQMIDEYDLENLFQGHTEPIKKALHKLKGVI